MLRTRQAAPAQRCRMRTFEEAWRMRVIPILALLASLILAVNVMSFLHELGHAIGGWLYGGELHKLLVHPFSISFVSWRALPDEGRFLMTSGGFLFGWLLVRLRRRGFACCLLNDTKCRFIYVFTFCHAILYSITAQAFQY